MGGKMTSKKDINEKLLSEIGFHGCSDTMLEVLTKVKKFQKAPSRVLIVGAYGTGKTMVANACSVPPIR
jgi:DNA-binding NtrC family response regulator